MRPCYLGSDTIRKRWSCDLTCGPVMPMMDEKWLPDSDVFNLIEKGEIQPVLDRIYPFERITDAHYYVEKGHKKGNVVITI